MLQLPLRFDKAMLKVSNRTYKDVIFKHGLVILTGSPRSDTSDRRARGTAVHKLWHSDHVSNTFEILAAGLVVTDRP